MHPRGIEPRKPLRAWSLSPMGFTSSLQMRIIRQNVREQGFLKYNEELLSLVRTISTYVLHLLKPFGHLIVFVGVGVHEFFRGAHPHSVLRVCRIENTATICRNGAIARIHFPHILITVYPVHSILVDIGYWVSPVCGDLETRLFSQIFNRRTRLILKLAVDVESINGFLEPRR